ncbi:MAG: phenylalanine--tRNA ligase subunit alpha [Thermoplasmatales archaeon]
MELTNGEKKLIKYLKGKGYVGTEELFRLFDKNEVTSSISWLREKKIINVMEKPVTYFSIGGEGEKVLSSGLPEENLLRLYTSGKKRTEELEGIMGDDLRYGLAQVFKNGGRVINGELIIDNIEKIKEQISWTRNALESAKNGKITEQDARLLKPRKGFINEKVRMERTIKLTAVGEQIPPDLLNESDEINQITPEIIEKFNDQMILRPYDPTLYAPRYLPGKIHPLSEFIAEVREVMLEMGFRELKGQIVETAFWNMDMLFIPQNHPARDMQDTFYLKGTGNLDAAQARKVKRVHEKGIAGSKGWQYEWSKDEASKLLLRTHTTVNTIRYIIEHPAEECKIFSVEKIFRRENLDAQHLAEFSQVEGVISGKGVTFGVLIDTLETFYHRLGVKDVWVKPSYFPYTEPSLEVHGKFKGKDMELGGAGMFRPEVLKPWGIKYNVAAWGLGLERLLMTVLNLDDIRDIYRNDLSFLKERRMLKNIFDV